MQPTTPQLKNKRLASYDRDRLVRFARKQIEATEDRSELDAAYEQAADAIHAAVIAKWPLKDMKVLERYEMAAPDPCVYVSTGGPNYERFCYRDDDKRITSRPARGCGRQPILLEGKAEKAFDAYAAVAKRFDEQREARLSDFKALIYGSPTFNALAAAWPAVEAMRETIVGSGTALTVLSSEVTARLKQDRALMAVAA